MDFAIFHLDAVAKDQLSSVTRVINRAECEKYLWVHIPVQYARDYEIYQLDAVDAGTPVEVPYADNIVRDGQRPWLRINSEALDWTAGFHKYAVRLINRNTSDVVSLYFGYHSQDDNPDKPYIYMDRTECGCS